MGVTFLAVPTLTDSSSRLLLFACCTFSHLDSAIFLRGIMASVGFRIPTAVRLMIVCLSLAVDAENVEIVTPENTKPVTEGPRNVTLPDDSYLRAYEEMQKLRTGPAKRNDYPLAPPDAPPPEGPPPEGPPPPYDTVIRSSYLPDDRYPPLTHDWPRPAPPRLHRPPCVLPPTPYSSPPDPLLGLLPAKLKPKLLAKILLKLVLFKMVVKFVAVVCLLLFVPLLKSGAGGGGGGGGGGEVEERGRWRMGREVDPLASLVWGSLEGKEGVYGASGEEKDVGEVLQEAEEEDEEKDNYFAGPLKAVRFLEFCVSTVDRVVGFILGVLSRQATPGDDLASFFLDKLQNFVKNM